MKQRHQKFEPRIAHIDTNQGTGKAWFFFIRAIRGSFLSPPSIANHNHNNHEYYKS
jgi:hypothetical protein